MNPSEYCRLEDGVVRFERRGASAFAKDVAGDFNPIHDVDSRRFCVPGDLLFGVLLHRYGLYPETAVRFAGMVDAGVALALPADGVGESAWVGRGARRDLAVHLADERGREVLSYFGRGGAPLDDGALVARLARQYVRFSGRTFPEILGRLMREEGVMINPERPLVIYKDMALEVDRAAAERATSAALATGTPFEPTLELADATLSVTGKKGVVRLKFAIGDGAEARFGDGEKNLVLSGLRPFDEGVMASLVADYEARRERHAAAADDGVA